MFHSSEMHEATRRILGVLLRQLDGFEGKRSIVIGATNRKQDLDAALRSRFSSSIYFQLPSPTCRCPPPSTPATETMLLGGIYTEGELKLKWEIRHNLHYAVWGLAAGVHLGSTAKMGCPGGGVPVLFLILRSFSQ